MAVQQPTLEEFTTRFPQFEGQDDQIEAAIAEAVNEISEAWIEADQKTAIMYLVAHMLTEESMAEGSGGGGVVASESFGPISVSYASPSEEGDALLNGTLYGRRFLALRARSFPAIVVV